MHKLTQQEINQHKQDMQYKMYNDFFFLLSFRMPEMILLDQGGEFQNNFSIHLS